jgi:hypothetical protein
MRAGELLDLEIKGAQRKRVGALLRLRRAAILSETPLQGERVALRVAKS